MIKRTTLLPFALPDLGEAELKEIKEVVDSGWITTGAKAHLFEREFAGYVGAKFAVAVNSCTAAMHLSLEAIGLQAGDYVVTTPYTFAATAEVIHYFKAIPVFVDVERDTLNMDPACLVDAIEDLENCLESAQKPKTLAVARALGDGSWPTSTESQVLQTGGQRRAALRAVMPVHIAGHPCEMDAITAIADKHALPIIEDAAHACSASFNGRQIGSAIGDRPGLGRLLLVLRHKDPHDRGGWHGDH